MPVNLRVPAAGESITEVRIGHWRKAVGDFVAVDEVVVELETDKAAMELPAPASGTLIEILKADGDEATVGESIAVIDESGEPPATKASRDTDARSESQPPEPTAQRAEAAPPEPPEPQPEPPVMPAAARVLGEARVSVADAKGTGRGGRVLKEDALRAVEASAAKPPPTPSPATPTGRREESVPMTPLRKIIAGNLVAAQQNAALLSTFNEIDMSAVIDLRKRYRDAFQERHGIKLGFMSFFVKACVDALQAVPGVNARVDGSQIVYRHYQDIGIAVGSGRGLVVPVLRDADAMSFADIERAISDFGARAQQNRIELSELQGGTFTITNGGIYGSLLSTPIVNPPQSGILGMHAIQDRPMAVNGQVVVRPMMYVALTYDHRVVDGREAVTFLGRIKELVEGPERIWLQV